MVPRFRGISTARLSALRRVHLRPINVVISYDPPATANNQPSTNNHQQEKAES